MSMGWYYCWICTRYFKWHDTSDTLDCGHPPNQDPLPTYDFNTDDQYEEWLENGNDPTAPEIEEKERVFPMCWSWQGNPHRRTKECEPVGVCPGPLTTGN